MNDNKLSMITLIMERLIDWKYRISRDNTVTFYEVYFDVQKVLEMANDVLTIDSINTICRTIEENRDSHIN